MLPDYEHIFCNECGGVIGMRYRSPLACICDRCGKKFIIYELDYDVCKINHETGWIFPVKYRDKEQLK